MICILVLDLAIILTSSSDHLITEALNKAERNTIDLNDKINFYTIYKAWLNEIWKFVTLSVLLGILPLNTN